MSKIDLEAGTVTRPLSDKEKQQELLAQFMVNELRLLPPSSDGERLSGGHGWHRTSEAERVWFRNLARQQISQMRNAINDQRGYDGKGWVR